MDLTLDNIKKSQNDMSVGPDLVKTHNMLQLGVMHSICDIGVSIIYSNREMQPGRNM